ncbi:MAG TPA: hypothetical protein VFB54_14190 [Burkholderiales bacterium]|nr:hypothetical protein [Burkholderiales bacterium]
MLCAVHLAVLLTGMANAMAASADDSQSGNTKGWLDAWFERSDRAKETQPHWITPLVTVTPRLEQEVRYDQLWQRRPNASDFTSYGGGKGLELIPTEHTEIIIGVPAYQVRETRAGREHGWADETFLFKYRLLSANEENGNYIVSGFLGLSVPTGSDPFTTGHTIVTPTLAVGKGWGTRESGFDVQSTLSISYPDGNEKKVGVPIVWNTAFQAHVFEKFWPEVETHYTHWTHGSNAGKSQLAVTAGMVAGRFPIAGRIRLVVGVGYQEVVTDFKAFDHAWIATGRVVF